MFDYHMHSMVSFDGKEKPEDMIRAAEAAGLKEICFTDHIDFDPRAKEQTMFFTLEDYSAAYDHLTSDKLKIRRGLECGMISDRPELMVQTVAQREGVAPWLLLIEARKGGNPGLQWEPPMILEQPDGSPSPIYREIYGLPEQEVNLWNVDV